MISATILIKLIDGSVYSYANKYLVEKTGYDGYINPTPLFKGYDSKSYYYTNLGNDKYEDQTGLGKIKGDFEYLENQILAGGEDFILFPEADEDHNGTSTLVRKNNNSINGGKNFNREKIKANSVISIEVQETFVDYPYGRESGYNLPKDDPNFRGFNEYAEITKEEKGEDFDAHKDDYLCYVPEPLLSLSGTTLTIENFNDFDTVYYSFDKGITFSIAASNTINIENKKNIECYGKKSLNEKTKSGGKTYMLFKVTVITDDDGNILYIYDGYIINSDDGNILYSNNITIDDEDIEED